ncbi:MAG: Lrp/AsnC family transcriptional regulator [Leptospirales bacterium]
MLKTLTDEEIRILTTLEEKGNIPNAELALLIKIDEAKVREIIKNLTEQEIILKYKAIINWEKIESPGVAAVIQVTASPRKGEGYDEVAHAISSFEEVRTCLLVSGSFDLLVEVEGPSLKAVAFFVADKLATIDGVEHTRTNFLLKRYKQGGDLLNVSGTTHRLPLSM